MPTHDGRERLVRLLTGLASITDYSQLEVLVVDNASRDGTLEWLEAADLPFPLGIIRNARNRSFSAAMNAGAAEATGRLLLFLNDDIEPIEPHWLDRLVLALETSGAGIAGAVLVDPDRTSATGKPYAIQHAGLAFRLDRGVLRPLLVGLGQDLSQIVGADRTVAAVAAACALMDRNDFHEIGGFDEGFCYGGEDVDLCLRLALHGRTSVLAGSSVLLHRPMSTRGQLPDASASARTNHRLLLERWGPALRREYALDIGRGSGLWNGDGGAASAKVSFCVKPSPAPGPTDPEAIAAAIREAGHEAHSVERGDSWLLDDVVWHLLDGPGRHALVPGRLNVLVRRGDGAATGPVGRYDLVVPADLPVSEVISRVLSTLTARGGPRRAAVKHHRDPPGSCDQRSGGPASRPRVTLVLGMARTGTSATMRILNILGVTLGEPQRLLAPIADNNEKGFFEHYAIMRLNTELLRRFGGSWRDPPNLPAGWESDPRIDDLRVEAEAIVQDEFSGRPLWGFKDPRTCLTLPFWRPLIGPAAFVICHRHPLEIIASLERRDGLSDEHGLNLWRRYTATAITETANDERTFVGYATLLADTSRVTRTLDAFLGQPGRAPRLETQREIEGWLDPELRHHSHTLLDLMQSPQLKPLDVKLCLLLELATRTQPDACPDQQNLSDALNVTAARILDGLAIGPTSMTRTG